MEPSLAVFHFKQIPRTLTWFNVKCFNFKTMHLKWKENEETEWPRGCAAPAASCSFFLHRTNRVKGNTLGQVMSFHAHVQHYSEKQKVSFSPLRFLQLRTVTTQKTGK